MSPAGSVLVVVPTYNEAGNVATVLRRLRGCAPFADVLVVDDDSPDGTAEVAETVGGELGRISVLHHGRKRGIGGAYRDGLARGLEEGYEVLVEMDGDHSHDPAALPNLLAAVAGGADLAIGSRYVPGGSIQNWPWHRRVLSRYGNRYAQRALGLPVVDATSGYRAYRASALRRAGLGECNADGHGFQIEIAYRLARAGGTLVEVPISFTDRTSGSSKISAGTVLETVGLVTRFALSERYQPQPEASMVFSVLPGYRKPGMGDGAHGPP
ncbi:MAG: polyprenol monophosphomannose synthase [Actinomycetota bacterium]|nr:polyprenol monophosphomannose synthase [Actinomycetota bacterium]